MVSVRVPIDLPQDRGPMVPLAYRGNCSCAATQFVIVSKDGRERVSLGRPTIEHAVLPGDKLFLELTIDTRRKEASEQKATTNSGDVLVTDLADKFGRISIPISFTFGIATPIVLSPFAHVEFGELPLSRRFSVTLELRPRPGTHAQFLSATASDPRVSVELRPPTAPERAAMQQPDDVSLLDVRVVPDRGLGLGSLHTMIRVQTDLPDGYVVPIPVTGQIVSDIEVKPMERVSFGRFDFTQPQEGSVVLHDYDLSRAPEFEVLAVRALVGKGVAQHVRAELQPTEGDERGARLVLRYDGGLRQERSFRGFVDVGKRGSAGSLVSIEFVGFSHD